MAEVKARAGALLKEASAPSLGQLEGALRDLGFSGYAAQAFCAAVQVPQATAGDLILKTGIPDSKIYYALDELAERGLLEVQAGKPKVYRVGSPKEVEARLRHLLDEKQERERAAVARVASIIEPLRSGARSPTIDLAYLVKGAENVTARALGMIASARSEVVLLSSDSAFFRKLEGDLLKASRRKVRLQLAIPTIPMEEDLARRAEVREIVCSCVTLVVDREQMLTVNRTADGGVYGITSTDETLVRLGLDYWQSPRCCSP
jgi:sugar-specific transcriptional regulator TrmB